MRLAAHADRGKGIFKLTDNELGLVKELINKQLAGRGDSAAELLLRNFNPCEGKMLRPSLALLSYHAVRDTLNKTQTRQNTPSSIRNTNPLIRVAAIFELIHNATLLHDDIPEVIS